MLIHYLIGILSVPLLVIVLAEMIITIYSYLYVGFVMFSQLFQNPGETVLASQKIIEDLKEFKRKHLYTMRYLVGKSRMQYQINASDAPDILRNLSQEVLKDPVYDTCLWLAWPLEWVFRFIARRFERYEEQ